MSRESGGGLRNNNVIFYTFKRHIFQHVHNICEETIITRFLRSLYIDR